MNAEKKIPIIYRERIEEVLDYITYFCNIKEADYITYAGDNTFEYSTELKSFINSLYQANLVEDEEAMQHYLDEESRGNPDKCRNFNEWIRIMNQTISRPDLLRKTDILFLRRAFLTLIRMEDFFPGSWGIDVEVGTWLKLLRRLKALYEAGDY